MKNPYVWGFLIGILGLHLYRELSHLRRWAPPPVLLVQNWSLTDETGQAFGSTQLKGKVVIANVIAGDEAAATLTHGLAEVAKRFGNEGEQVQFVTILADPTRREMLEWSAALPKLKILSGAPDLVREVLNGKLKLALLDGQSFPALLLFDQNGDLRATLGTEMTNLASMVSAAKFLLEAAKG